MKKIIAVLAIILISASVQASRVDWEIQFYDDIGIQVGGGDFSYDPDITDQYFTDSPNPYDVPIRIEVSTVFTSIDWIIDDFQWSAPSRGGPWWGGSMLSSRYGTSPGSFILGNHIFGPSLFLTFNPPHPGSATTAFGSWAQLANNRFPSGTWSANRTSAVPIPGVFVLFGSGIISLIMFRRKSVGSKKK